jgi:tetratricopeptide (TPR) repeat protein
MAVAAAIGAFVVAAILDGARSVGAGTGVTSFEYLLTQCRAILLYLRLFVFPIGQNADRDFPISRSLNEHGAAIALVVLAALLLVLVFRSITPLVRYGALLFFALLAPTSSLIPLADPFAEHRMYLPIVGLAIALTGALANLPIPTTRFALTSAAVTVLAFSLTAQRASIWSDGVLFWSDVVAKSPAKDRGYSHLINAYVIEGRCDEAVDHIRRVGNAVPRDYFVAFNMARAHACAKRPSEALTMLQEAERLNPTADVYGFFGDILWSEDRTVDAQAAYTKALAKQPSGTDLSHVYKGHIALLGNNRTEAEQEYRNALNLNPYSPEALAQLRRLQAAASGQTRSRSHDFLRSTLSGVVDAQP